MIRIAGLLIFFGASAWFAFGFFSSGVSLLPNGVQDFRWFVLGAALCATQPVFLGIGSWAFLPKRDHNGPFMQRCISILCISQFAKYIPGNISHHVGRIAMSKLNGIPIADATFAMYLEIVNLIAIASIIGATAVAFTDVLARADLSYAPDSTTLVLIAAAAVAAPYLGHRVFERVAQWLARRQGNVVSTPEIPTMAAFWMAGGLYCLVFLVPGFVLALIATKIFYVTNVNILTVSGIFAVAWIAGFITPGAPAGLGVREVILTAAMTPLYGQEAAVGSAAVLRVVTVLGDALAFVIGLGIGKLADNQAGEEDP